MKVVEITCIRGKAKLRVKGRFVNILCNNRRKWDHFHWSFFSDDSLALQGLWRGRYADAVATIDNVVAALRELGCNDKADNILKYAQ